MRRGFSDAARRTASCTPTCVFHSPYLLAGMAAARERIDRALSRGERITCTATTTPTASRPRSCSPSSCASWAPTCSGVCPTASERGLRHLAARPLDELAAAGAGLLLTVDCGIGVDAEVPHARELGARRGRHRPSRAGERCPPSASSSTPSSARYPFPHLAGVGVALKLAHALLVDRRATDARRAAAARCAPTSTSSPWAPSPTSCRCSTRTAAWSAMGLGRLRSAPRPGLAALLEVSDTRPDDVDAATLGFRLAPRLNAAGRLGRSASLAVRAARRARPRGGPAAGPARSTSSTRRARRSRRAILREALARLPEPLPAALVLPRPTGTRA